jgi:hypothetical protein
VAEEPRQHTDEREVSQQQFVNRPDDSSEYAERRRGLDSMQVPPPRPVAASAATDGPPDSGQGAQGDSSAAPAPPANGAPADYDG